jgi:hypothetical protein
MSQTERTENTTRFESIRTRSISADLAGMRALKALNSVPSSQDLVAPGFEFRSNVGKMHPSRPVFSTEIEIDRTGKTFGVGTRGFGSG